MNKVVQEEPEEGEIIDDFEVISDYSIPSSPVSGKSVPHRDLLRDVSLSSISDSEPDIFRNSISCASSKHHHKRKRKKSPYRQRIKSRRYDSDSSESDFSSTLQKQLKRAVRIDHNSVEVSHNSLQTRLKAMLGKTVESRQEDEELNALREVALLSSMKDKNDKESRSMNQNDGKQTDEDEELFQLRIDALKSAMIRKAAERKKRKENKENDVNKDNKDTENNQEIKEDENADKKNETSVQNGSNNNNNSIDEDIDIMRAMLLVSMSDKVIPKDTKLSIPIASVPKKSFPKPICVKPVKQLIINLKDSDDSDSEEIKTTKIKDTHSKTDKIDEFLKIQRAAVEEKYKKQQNEKEKSNLLDKSVVKFMPKSQQREYQILKQKLLMARRKKLRKTSIKLANNVAIQQAKANGQKQETRVTFQKALEDMQVKKSGRLQMKGKYKALAPLQQKVNHASIERKQCELVIKKLLAELQKARDKLHVSHQNYVGLVAKLIKARNAIDRGASIAATVKKNRPLAASVKSLEEKKTSTPIRDPVPQVCCDLSSINVGNTSPASGVPACATEDKREEETKKCENIKTYVSPLDTRNSDPVNNPLTMYCPFELFGVCKDPECQFNHCSQT